MSEQNTVDEVVKETRADYDLIGHLQGRKLITNSLTVYTDEEAGKEHAALVERIAVEKRKAHPAFTAPDTGEILVPAAESDEELIAKLEAEKKELDEVLRATSITYHWRTVPKVAVKEARRKAKAVNADIDSEEYQEYLTAWLLHRAITKYFVREHGIMVTSLPVEQALGLSDFLPPSEFVRLSGAYARDQFKTDIAGDAVSEPDF